ncbi:hypothetical protein [Mesorhizobium sp. SP-1A]|uniref:hypothetical protein n=1 Tax=Mesorhizobium sp. SP-1A TaxID=3077840 RepID=UPI0028F6E410|nr:hypothetical protein [Mesorhizobium sp. SP-1A]
MNHVSIIAAATIVVGLAGAASAAETLNSMDEVGAAIQKCWSPPADSNGSSVTLRFSFKRDGTLMGPPMASGVKVAGDEKKQKQFVQAAIDALQSCLPLSFGPKLAGGMAGNIFTMQFSSPKTE